MADHETIFGQVVAKANNYQAVPDGAGGRRIIKSDAVREYERSFKRQCRVYAGMKIDRPFVFDVVVYESSRRYDLDNSLKTLLDCLQMCDAITDDNLCIEIRARKAVDPRRPRVVYSLHEVEPMLFNPNLVGE
ncbi:MAG: RusA family crossover junction endodeoxyribonuclease [Bacteroidaceae bacterium]|nr:RusA family crossover junction endodeoxyribonuclease [Bacteroidaceae bacterium]